MTYPENTRRYSRAKDYKCPKCTSLNQHGQRKVQFVPGRTDYVNNNPIVTPEYIVVYCFYCGYQIGKFAPYDADMVPIDNGS